MASTIFSLLDTPAYGGAEQYLLSVLLNFQKKGHNVVLATNNAQVKAACKDHLVVIDLPYRLDAIGNWKGLVKYFLALPASLFWLVTSVKSLQKENHKIQNPKPKSNHVICLFPGYTDRLTFSPIVKWFGCRLIWLEYGPLEPTFARNHGFPKLLYAIGKTYPDRVVTISNWTRRSLIETGKIAESKIQIIYPGVELLPGRDKTKKKNQFTVIAVARLAKEKEIDLLLRAWAKLDARSACLQIVGDGPEREALEHLCHDLRITDSVEFVGFVSEQEKQQRLSLADLFVFPSAWELEGFGMTTIEAMAASLPVVTTGYGPQSEIVEDQVTGWYFKAHDAQALAETIERARRSPTLRDFGKSGQRRVQKIFSSQAMLSAWEKIILAE